MAVPKQGKTTVSIINEKGQSILTGNADLSMSWTGSGYVSEWQWLDMGSGKIQKKSHDYVPEIVYFNTEKKTTVVKWNDGTETKVTCAPEDEFSPEAGFNACVALKVFGNDKKKFKDFWYPVVSRRFLIDGKKQPSMPYGRWEKEREESKAKKKVKSNKKVKK